jgi:hypothetical protein
MKLFIRNMVNHQSLTLVKAELDKLGIRDAGIVIGEVNVHEELTLTQLLKLRIALRQSGLQLLEKKSDIPVHRRASLLGHQKAYLQENTGNLLWSEHSDLY